MASRAVTRARRAGNDPNPDPPVTPFTVAGYIVLTINEQQFTLDGIVGATIDVQFHRGFNDAVAVGTLPTIITGVAAALGVPASFATQVNTTVNGLPAPLPKLLNEMVIKITDVGINTGAGVYQFGFCCDLTSANVEIGGVKLNGFGVRITYKK